MTKLRIPFALHGAIDQAAGLGLMALPFILGFSAPATFVALALGVLLVGLGLATTAPDGRGTLAPGAHAAYDLGLSVGLILAGFAVGIFGDVTAFAVLAGIGVSGLLVSGITRYSVAYA